MAGIEELLIGRRLADRYRVEEVIGRGGMGAVYAAVDERLGRRVAIKVITLAAAEPEARERQRARFRREAQAAAGIHHPNVAVVHDFATDAELGLDLLVMELLQGEDLTSRLARTGPPPLPLGLRILQDAAAGLAAGHRGGLIHRDVKPGNLFLAEGNTEGELRVCVLDFGIARLAVEDESLTQITTEGAVGPLSPAYASPEQLRGERDLTPASDVYSLGLVGFELLTGSRLFASDDLMRASTPIPPPRIRVLNPAVPAGVDELLRQALAHEPQARFPDAAAFAAALEGVTWSAATAPAPPSVAPPSPPIPAPPAAEEGTVLLPPEPEEATATLLAPSALPPRAETRGATRTRRHARSLIPLLALLLLAVGLAGGAVLLGSGGSSAEAAAPDQSAEVPAIGEERTNRPAAAPVMPAPALPVAERVQRSPPAPRAQRDNGIKGGKAGGRDKLKKDEKKDGDKPKKNGKGNKGKNP